MAPSGKPGGEPPALRGNQRLKVTSKLAARGKLGAIAAAEGAGEITAAHGQESRARIKIDVKYEASRCA
jgi:hypothetical protein